MDIKEQLDKAQMPVPLRAEAISEIVIPEFESKLEKAKGMMLDNTPLVFLIGNDSPYKDAFAAALMKGYMVQKNKTGRWFMPPRSLAFSSGDEVGVAGVTTVVALDLYPAVQAKAIGSIIRDALGRGRAFIVCCSSIEIAEELLGKEFMAFVSHQSVTVNAGVPRAKILEI